MIGYRLVFVSGNRCFKVVTVDNVNEDGLTWSEAVEHCRNDVPGYKTDLASIRDSVEMGKYFITYDVHYVTPSRAFRWCSLYVLLLSGITVCLR